MNAREFLSHLPLGPGDTRQTLLYARLLISYLADNVYSLELANGVGVRTVTNLQAFCEEVMAESKRLAAQCSKLSEGTEVSSVSDVRARPKMTPRPQQRWDECNRCGHVHEGSGECGVRMGPNVICRCELELSS